MWFVKNRFESECMTHAQRWGPRILHPWTCGKGTMVGQPASGLPQCTCVCLSFGMHPNFPRLVQILGSSQALIKSHCLLQKALRLLGQKVKRCFKTLPYLTGLLPRPLANRSPNFLIIGSLLDTWVSCAAADFSIRL